MMDKNMWKIRNYYDKLRSKAKNAFSVTNILIIYRYISFLVCMFLYFITAPQDNIGRKIGIMCMLVIVFSTMGCLYLENREDRKNTLILSIVEAVENSIFIIISGGFTSPFIWYFVSTVFITAVKISYFLAVVYSAVYFIIAAVSSIYFLQSVNNIEVERLHMNTAISCIIIVFVILQLIRYAEKVEEKSQILAQLNRQLEEAGRKVEKTLKYSIEVYETINIFNSHGSGDILFKLLEHFSYISGINQLILIRLTSPEDFGSYISYGLSAFDSQKIHAKAMELISGDQMQSAQIKSKFDDGFIAINYIKYESDICGAFVAFTQNEEMLPDVSDNFFGKEAYNQYRENIIMQNYDIFPLFMKIAGIAIKQLEFKKIEEQLLISEEQNRIANEIHDIVLQRLFAISCKLYVLSRAETSGNLNGNLMEIKESIDMAMKELRETIYGLSWEKKGKDTFRQKLTDYAKELQMMHDVKINLSFHGDMQKINQNQKRGLYRVICESMSNAIRHGKAKHIDVQLIIDNDKLHIQIADDGTGFDFETVRQKKEIGLGLNNISRIIEMMNGKISFKTGTAQSTRVIMEIPCKPAV